MPEHQVTGTHHVFYTTLIKGKKAFISTIKNIFKLSFECTIHNGQRLNSYIISLLSSPVQHMALGFT